MHALPPAAVVVVVATVNERPSETHNDNGRISHPRSPPTGSRYLARATYLATWVVVVTGRTVVVEGGVTRGARTLSTT